MSERAARPDTRRKFLLWVGGSMAALPLIGLSACTPEEAEPPPTTDDEPADSGPDPGTPARTDAPSATAPQPTAGQAAPADAAAMPKLDENSQTAQALGYKHDATKVDREQFPSRSDADSANELCKTCMQFQGSPDQQWAPCTIFPGKLVNADGWCSAWVAKG